MVGGGRAGSSVTITTAVVLCITFCVSVYTRSPIPVPRIAPRPAAPHVHRISLTKNTAFASLRPKLSPPAHLYTSSDRLYFTPIIRLSPRPLAPVPPYPSSSIYSPLTPWNSTYSLLFFSPSSSSAACISSSCISERCGCRAPIVWSCVFQFSSRSSFRVPECCDSKGLLDYFLGPKARLSRSSIRCVRISRSNFGAPSPGTPRQLFSSRTPPCSRV